jgi:glutathionyl-hydroquinone reductase
MSGYLLDGHWHEGWYDITATAGEFVCTQAIFRHMFIGNAKNIYLAESGLHRRTSR